MTAAHHDEQPQQQAYDELCCYTLAHYGPEFIHQHVVDAFAAQTATVDDKPIKIVFALVGLYLHVERGFTGKQAELAHMKMATRKQPWPAIDLPVDRGDISASDVLAAEPGDARDNMIHQWCQVVWSSYRHQGDFINSILRSNKVAV